MLMLCVLFFVFSIRINLQLRSFFSGGPLMVKRQGKYILIGTVFGAGYDCRTGKFITKHGLNNKVSQWVDWIRWQMFILGETVCESKRQEPLIMTM